MLKVGSKFDTFEELSDRLEEFQKLESVQLWVRDSRTVLAAAKRARRKSLNPALRYAELTYSCVFGGRRPSDQSKVHNQTSAGGCPFKVRLSTSSDGQALVVKEICHDHNHEPGKKLHDEPRRLFKKSHTSRAACHSNSTAVKGDSGAVSQQPAVAGTTAIPTATSKSLHKPIKLIVSKNRVNSGGANNGSSTPFANLQQQYHHNQCATNVQPHQAQPLKLQLHHASANTQQCYFKKEDFHQITDLGLSSGTPEHVDTPDHLLNMDSQSQFPYFTPSNTNTPASSSTNTPRVSPNNSPPTGWSSGPDEGSYIMPPSPISPANVVSSVINPSTVDGCEDVSMEPLHDLQEALEEGLDLMPSFVSDELPLSCSSRINPRQVLGSATTPASNSTASCAQSNISSSNRNIGIPGGTITTTSITLPASRIRGTAGMALPQLIKTLPPGNTIKVGYPADNGNITFSSVYKPASNSNGFSNVNNNLVITSTDSASVLKAVKPKNATTTNLLYNVLCNSSSKSLSSSAVLNHNKSQSMSAKNGRITVIGTVEHINGTNPTVISSGIATHKTTHDSLSSSFSDTDQQKNGTTNGPVRNYRAKISKKPYSCFGTLKVIKSDVAKPYEVSNGLSVSDQSTQSTSCPYRILKMEPGTILSANQASMLSSPYSEMDQIISGGIDTSNSKTEVLADAHLESAKIKEELDLYSNDLNERKNQSVLNKSLSMEPMLAYNLDQVLRGGVKSKGFEEEPKLDFKSLLSPNHSDDSSTSDSIIGGAGLASNQEIDSLFVWNEDDEWANSIPAQEAPIFSTEDLEKFDIYPA